LLLPGSSGYYMGNNPEAREDKNIYFGVAKEPEEVLKENRVSSSCRVKERGVNFPVCKEHCDRSG